MNDPTTAELPASKSKVRVLRGAGLATVLALASGCAAPSSETDDAPSMKTWYVQAGSGDSPVAAGDGSRGAPLSSLAQVESASGPGDEIVVLTAEAGTGPLDGSLALQRGQLLRGEPGEGRSPRITNSDPTRAGGDVVTLADDSTVESLHFVGAAGHAVVGRDVQGTTVRDNRFSGGNLSQLSSVDTGATAGLGVAAFPKGVVAFIFEEESGSEPKPNTVVANEIGGIREESLTRLGGAGIAVHAGGRARASLHIAQTRISDLGPGFPRSGILVDAQDDARLEMTIEDCRVGNAFGSSDGILIVAQHRSTIGAEVRRYRYVGGTPDQGLGNNGLEVATYHGRDWLTGEASGYEKHEATTRLLVEDSDMEGAAGFGIVVLNVFGKPSSETVYDFGGGELGGRGGNRIHGNGSDLPLPMEVFVVHHDLDMTGTWWGLDRDGRPKASEVDGIAALDASLAFLCPGEEDQLRMMIEETGTSAWSMFCQTLRPDICVDGSGASCCDPAVDEARCLVSLEDSSLHTSPALAEDPRPGAR